MRPWHIKNEKRKEWLLHVHFTDKETEDNDLAELL
jgi:hypothetical protein